MARLSNDQRLSNLHADALRQFNDIQTALRRTGRFASLQTSVSDPTAEGGGGQPFDVTAVIATPAAKEAP